MASLYVFSLYIYYTCYGACPDPLAEQAKRPNMLERYVLACPRPI
jgi:hypothetical protein